MEVQPARNSAGGEHYSFLLSVSQLHYSHHRWPVDTHLLTLGKAKPMKKITSLTDLTLYFIGADN